MAFDLDDDELRATRKSKGLDDGLYEEKAKLVSQIATNFGIDFTEAKMMIEQSLMNFGKEFSMSEADKMFEELVYKKIIENKIKILYEKEGRFWDKEIRFDLMDKQIRVEMSTGDSEPITIQELQAINKKCKELGWL